MKIFNVKLLAAIFIMQMTFAHSAMAGKIGPDNWNGDHIEGFLAHGAFPGDEIEQMSFNFGGEWMYTAIGRESGNTNDIEQAASATVGSGSTDAFTTANTDNWGEWATVDFETENLWFEDSNGPYDLMLNPFGGINDPGFRLFQLTEATILDYLAGAPQGLSLFAGDIVVGFNDNPANSTDSDYDDIIIVMRSASVPEPGSLALLSLGLLGLGFMRRKTA